MPVSSDLSPRHPAGVARSTLAGVALVSGALLMTELALTRIFSVTMYYHFAFLAISVALFGLSASGVYVYLARRRLDAVDPEALLSRHALAYAVVTGVALAFLLRIRVGLNYSPRNLVLMLTIYALAALPFFAGGAVLSIAIARLRQRINLVYAADLIGAAAGCLLLFPLTTWLGAPGVILGASLMGAAAALLFSPPPSRRRVATAAAAIALAAVTARATGLIAVDLSDTKGHAGDRVLFSKWNSFSRVAVYDRAHGDWSLSPIYKGPLPETRFMDIDSAASTPILRSSGNPAEAGYLRYELTALAYHVLAPEGGLDGRGEASRPTIGAPAGRPPDRRGFRALVIGPGGGRDLLTALVFGAARVDGVEINPIIARDVMQDRFREYSGRLYLHPRVRVSVDDGRSFVRRSPDRYDIIQASLVDTWAATAAGAYTLSENSLYTVEAFEDYLSHLDEDGILTITRWVFDGLRLVSLAQEACERLGIDVRDRLAIAGHDKVATFMLKRSPFTAPELARLAEVSGSLGFSLLYAPGLDWATRVAATPRTGPRWSTAPEDYARLILAPDRKAFYERYPLDVRPTTDDRPFFFHTTKLRDQTHVAFGRSMLFGNGLSALMTLMAISAALVLLFILVPLVTTTRNVLSGSGWLRWLAYFGCLGAGFMLFEIPLLQRFVLLLGHPTYSLTVTLFSLLLGTGLGSYLSRRLDDTSLGRALVAALAAVAFLAILTVLALPTLIELAMPAPRAARLGLAVALLLPIGLVLGLPLPAGMRLLTARRPALIPWAWALNGALSVVGATAAVFIAMNWGFSATLLTGAASYALGAAIIATTP
jgi:hypothetical protein